MSTWFLKISLARYYRECYDNCKVLTVFVYWSWSKLKFPEIGLVGGGECGHTDLLCS